MGYRLIGPAIKIAENRELMTEGTNFGSIQVPPNGQPIILMADRQPTGGYPKIGQVIQSDIPKIGHSDLDKTSVFRKSLCGMRNGKFGKLTMTS